MIEEFETIDLTGINLKDATAKAPLLKFRFGLGYSRAASLPFPGDSHKRWTVAVDVLPDLPEYTILSDVGGVQTRYEYFYDFWHRHACINKPFILVHPTDKKRWLVGFVETELPHDYINAKIMSVKGLAIEQRIEPGVSYLADGSLGDVENPDEI